MANDNGQQPECVALLRNIDVEDLQYLEKDLCFYEVVSLGFLLFGHRHAEFVLQKLLVLNNSSSASGNIGGDLLRQYASIDSNWRATLVEALAIIDARRVLRKLGLQWQAVRQYYLPHIAELSVHVQPLLKALYKMCERLTPTQAGRLALEINEQQEQRTGTPHLLRFYDSTYLEIYLLDWLTRRIISVGEVDATGANVQVLIDYFKLNDMYSLKMLLLSVLSNAERPLESSNVNVNNAGHLTAPLENALPQESAGAANAAALVDALPVAEIELHERYLIRRERAGNILIINQKEFHLETAAELQHLLPSKALGPRSGTDVDKQKLIEVFTSYGYVPIELTNLTHNELCFRIGEAVQRSFLFDSLIVCILSHGIDGAVYGSNSIPVEIAEIEHIITAKPLEGKPKMLIIQACQIPNESDGQHKTSAAATSSMAHKSAQRNVRGQSLSHLTDMIKAMSTVSGFPSMRHTRHGTWFVQSLCTEVHRYGDRKHMLDILTAVQRDVVNRRGNQNEIMVPQYTNTLTKHFFLPRRMQAPLP